MFGELQTMLGEVGLARGVENMDPFALEMLHELPLQLGHLEAFQNIGRPGELEPSRIVQNRSFRESKSVDLVLSVVPHPGTFAKG